MMGPSVGWSVGQLVSWYGGWVAGGWDPVSAYDGILKPLKP